MQSPSVRRVSAFRQISLGSAPPSQAAGSSFRKRADSRSGTDGCCGLDRRLRLRPHQSLPILGWPSRAGTLPRPGVWESQTVLSSSGVHPPQGVDPGCDWNNPTPLLGAHDRRFNAHTGRSVLSACIGTLCLAFRHLAGSLGITRRVPAVPPKRLNRARALSMPDTAHPVHRLPMGSSQRYLWPLVLMSAVQFRHLNEGSWLLAFSIHT